MKKWAFWQDLLQTTRCVFMVVQPLRLEEEPINSLLTHNGVITFIRSPAELIYELSPGILAEEIQQRGLEYKPKLEAMGGGWGGSINATCLFCDDLKMRFKMSNFKLPHAFVNSELHFFSHFVFPALVFLSLSSRSLAQSVCDTAELTSPSTLAPTTRTTRLI